MTHDDIIRMAREAGHHVPYAFTLQEIERFAALVAAATRESMRAGGWRACAVGQRETQHCGLLETAVLAEREACARVCEAYDHADPLGVSLECASFIRARGKTKDAPELLPGTLDALNALSIRSTSKTKPNGEQS